MRDKKRERERQREILIVSTECNFFESVQCVRVKDISFVQFSLLSFQKTIEKYAQALKLPLRDNVTFLEETIPLRVRSPGVTYARIRR